MNIATIKKQSELEALINKGKIEINGSLEIECDIFNLPASLNVSGNISSSGNISASGYISARGYISASDISARDISACDISACDISACDISACDISARDISARDISARGNISASDISARGNISARNISARGNISARNISARGYISARNISASDIFVLSFYAVAAAKITCNYILPLSGLNDRSHWADRFGIDTAIGCYIEFKERLSKVAKTRLRNKTKYSSLERQMLEAAAGKYKKID